MVKPTQHKILHGMKYCNESDRVMIEDDKKLERMRAALENLHAMVLGECPSLLNEDSGGNGLLAIEIEDLLRQ